MRVRENTFDEIKLVVSREIALLLESRAGIVEQLTGALKACV